MRSGFFLVVLLLGGAFPAESVLLVTTDGGVTWSREHVGISYPLNAVSVDPLTGLAVAVGDRGTIMRKEQGGDWNDVSPSGVDADLRSVTVGFEGVCMACGDSGALLSSFDRGNTWRVWSEFSFEDIDLLSVNFDPSATGSFIITGEEGFVYTSSDRVVETGSSFPFIGSGVQLCSSFPEVVVSSAGEIYYSLRDSLYSPSDSLSLNGVTPIVSGGGAFSAVGDEGLICSLIGGNWAIRESPTTEDLFSVASISHGRNLCAVGENGTILLSTDGGETWSLGSSGVSGDLNGVAGDGSGVGYIVGDSFWGRFFPETD